MDRALGDLNAVLVFVEVVGRHSFRGAAQALGVPRSTVSFKVAQLEDALGVRLLERTTRTLRLTDAGMAYYRQSAAAIDSLREAATTVTDLQKQPSGRLRLTTAVEFGQTVLSAVLDGYARAYPAVEVQVELCDRQVDLIEEGFDLAIRAGALPDSSLIARALPTCPYQLYASKAYLRAHGEPEAPAQLLEHDCLIMTAQRSPRSWQFVVGRKDVTVEVRGKIAVNSLRVLRELAAAGRGIARLPQRLGEEPGAPPLHRVLEDFAPDPLPWHAVYPSARNLSPKVRAFIDLLEQELRHRRIVPSRARGQGARISSSP